MAGDQKPLNQIGIFLVSITPRKLLYLMISVNLIKFVPHWQSVFFFSFWGGGGTLYILFNNVNAFIKFYAGFRI